MAMSNKQRRRRRDAALKADARQMRAREFWPYYDTVCIRQNADTSKGWFQSFTALANRDYISFFDQRNRSEVDAAYCNLDTESQLDVGYRIHSLGIAFFGPPVGEVTIDQEVVTAANGYNSLAWQKELINHCSFELWLNQDQKIDVPVTLAPAGLGFGGQGNPIGDPTSGAYTSGPLGQFSNGIPDLNNRWKWAKKITVPRNHRLSGRLTFSKYAKSLLVAMGTPNLVYMGNSGQAPSDTVYPANYGIFVSLIGARYVQLRNAQTFR